jgi:hypothetical protein
MIDAWRAVLKESGRDPGDVTGAIQSPKASLSYGGINIGS